MGTYNTGDFYPGTGAKIDSQGNVRNTADGFNADGSENIMLEGRNTTVQQIIGTSDGTVSIATSTTFPSQWINISSYKSVSVFVFCDQSYDLIYTRSHNGSVADQGVTVASAQGAVPTNTTRYQPITSSTDAYPYLKIQIKNDSGTTAANAKVYLVGSSN